MHCGGRDASRCRQSDAGPATDARRLAAASRRSIAAPSISSTLRGGAVRMRSRAGAACSSCPSDELRPTGDSRPWPRTVRLGRCAPPCKRGSRGPETNVARSAARIGANGRLAAAGLVSAGDARQFAMCAGTAVVQCSRRSRIAGPVPHACHGSPSASRSGRRTRGRCRLVAAVLPCDGQSSRALDHGPLGSWQRSCAFSDRTHPDAVQDPRDPNALQLAG